MTGRGETPSRDRIFVCRPSTTADELPCARIILSTLARRAFRRPVTDADVKPLLAFYQSGRGKAISTTASKRPFARCWSPRISCSAWNAIRPARRRTACVQVGDFELASRLSFFLWSSIPDDQLLDLAEKGKLRDPLILGQQVRRILDDCRRRPS